MVEAVNPNQITHEQLSAFVRSKNTLHTTLERAGFRLPNVNAPCCDLGFLMNVRDKTIWCPLDSDVNKMRVCFSPPPRSVLLDKFVQSIQAKHAAGEISAQAVKPLEGLITALKAKPANVDFLVLIVGILNPNDEVFEKSYVWKRPQKNSI